MSSVIEDSFVSRELQKKLHLVLDALAMHVVVFSVNIKSSEMVSGLMKLAPAVAWHNSEDRAGPGRGGPTCSPLGEYLTPSRPDSIIEFAQFVPRPQTFNLPGMSIKVPEFPFFRTRTEALLPSSSQFQDAPLYKARASSEFLRR